MINSNAELPKGWILTALDNVILKAASGTTEKQTNSSNGIPVTRIETISNEIVDLSHVGFLAKPSPELIAKYRLQEGDILFSNINSDLHLGKTALFKVQSLTILHGMNLLLIRPRKEIIYPEFLNYIFRFYRFSGKFIAIAQHAVNQSSINQTKLKKLEIPIAPLAEQARIVRKVDELLSYLNDGVTSIKKAKAQLKRYRQAVLKYAFEGKLTEEWRKVNKEKIELGQELFEQISQDRKINPHKYSEKSIPEAITQKLPSLPEEWTWISIEDCCEVTSGYAFRSKDFIQSPEIPVIKIGNIGYSEFLWQDQEYLPEIYSETFSKYLVQSDAILMALTRPITNDILKVCKYPQNAKMGLLNQRVAMVNPRGSLIKEGLFLFMQSPIFKTQVSNGMSQTLQPNLSPIMLEQFQVPLFSSLEQKEIVAEIQKRFSIANKINESVEHSLQLSKIMLQSVLRDAFAGKLAIQEPSDETAEILLQQIKSQKNAF